MELRWSKEEPPRWDETKRSIFGLGGARVFGLGSPDGTLPAEGSMLADEWWRATDGAVTVGYGRLDSLWGDAEILIGVVPQRRGNGVGGYVLAQLEREAARRGLNYLYNTVHPEHAEAEAVTTWLRRQGFADQGTGELRKRVPQPATPRNQ